MDDTAKVMGAVAVGYLLGRTKKMKLAIIAAGLLAGKKLPTSPRELSQQLMEAVENNPEMSGLVDQVRGDLMDSARAAAATTAQDQVTRLTGTIRDRTNAYTGAAEQTEPEQPDGADKRDDAGSGTAKKAASGTTKKAASGTTKKGGGTAKKAASGTTKKGGGTAKKAASGTAKKATSRSSSRNEG